MRVTPADLIALTLIAGEVEADQITAVGHTPVEAIVDAMRAELTPKFQHGWDNACGARKQYWRTGKRMGKSEMLARKLCRGALLHPRSINPYILPTATQARYVMWPILRRVVLQHVPTARILEHTMTVTMPEGGTIVVGGCETRSDVGRWFGMPFAEAAVDECGTFGGHLQHLVEDGLEPSLMDFNGHITLSGNPGPAPIGYWYECTGPARLSTVPLYTGDARDNPHVNAASFMASVLAENGWTAEHPTFQRMYLGEWANDPEALCFPFVASRNGIAGLPRRSLAGGELSASGWRYVIACDVAGVGTTAIVVCASHPGDPRMFVVSSENHPDWLPEQLVARIRQLQATTVDHRRPLEHAVVVVDTGGLGSVHAQYMTRKAGLHFEAADKREKASSIRSTRDELLAGRVQVLEGPDNDAIRGEWAVLEWDAGRELWLEGPPDHCADAGLYGLRRLRHYAREPVKDQDQSAAAIAEREAAKMRAARERKVAPRSGGRRAWDR